MSELRDTGERYELDEAGETAYANYRLQGDRLYIDYVFSPPALRGTGASGRLMAALSQDAVDKGRKVTPICGYAATWLRRSHQYRQLLD